MVHKELMTKRQLTAYEKMEKEVIRLNHKFCVGETVSVLKDDGSYEEDVIKHKFSIMSGNVVAWLKKNGSYLSERVIKDLCQ